MRRFVPIILTVLSLSVQPAFSQKLSYTTTWIGNSFGGGRKWVQNFVEDLHVEPNGTLYTASVWDEAGREFGIYRNGDVLGECKDTHGWGTLGGFAVASNSKYLFIAHLQGNEGGNLKGEEYPPAGFDWTGVSRRNKDGTHAPFPGGRGRFNDMIILHQVDTKTDAQIRGLAADEQHLYISDTYAGVIRVYNAETMGPIRNWQVHGKPTKLAIDEKGGLWAVVETTGRPRYKIVRFSTEGQILSQEVPLPSDAVPTDLCVDRKSASLLVADNGPSQQILVYANIYASPKLVRRFGEYRGVYGGKVPGLVGPLRFCGPQGVGVDSQGNLYVACNQAGGGTVLRAFSPKGKLLWELLGLEFVDGADADPKTQAADVFTNENHYKLDWSKTKPGSQWRWYAKTIDPFRYPNDPRLKEDCTGTAIRYIAGRRYLITTGMFQGFMGVFRFQGLIAVPSAIVSRVKLDSVPNCPAKGRWIWRDANGDGRFQAAEFSDADGVEEGEFWAWWMDEKGGIWYGYQTGEKPIHYLPLLGIDRFGNPIYSRRKAQRFDLPPGMNHLLRIEYWPETDTMFLTGYTDERPKKGGEWGIVGTEVWRIDGWMKGNRKPKWRAVLPYEADKLFTKSFCTAGDAVFAVECHSAKVHVFDRNTGRKLGEITPGPEVSRESGWVDFPDAIRAYRRRNGEYLIFVEEDWKAKTIVYRWKP